MEFVMFAMIYDVLSQQENRMVYHVMIAIHAVEALFVMTCVYAMIKFSFTGMGPRVFKVRYHI
jgi:hypothetical protein